MRSARSDGKETRRRIVEAASVVFARAGYHEATVARIREAAGVNQAAVNYHFGGKEQLYREVWDHTQAVAEESYPIEAAPDAPAEERLRVFLRHHIHRTLDEGPAGRFARILVHEIHDTRPVLGDEMREGWTRMNRIFESILRDLLGPGLTERDMELCRFSIMSPCIGLGMRLMRRKKKPIHHGSSLRFEPDELADHVYRFARSGIRDMKERIERRGEPAVPEMKE